MLYLNGSFKTSIPAPQNYYNFTGLEPDTLYELGTHTVDSSGNVNETWVNRSATTAHLAGIRFINGTVIDSVKKTSIAGVTIFTNTSLSTTTNASGFYSLPVPAGTYNLTAKFEPTYYSNNTISVSIQESTVVQDIELVRKPTGNITGSVKKAAGGLDPMPGISGTVIDSLNKTGIAGVIVSANASFSNVTDRFGFYSLAVSAGTYNLTAKFEPMYYTNNTMTVSTVLSAVVVQDIELIKKPMGNITGSVRIVISE
jgi:hypothetical protein